MFFLRNSSTHQNEIPTQVPYLFDSPFTPSTEAYNSPFPFNHTFFSLPWKWMRENLSPIYIIIHSTKSFVDERGEWNVLNCARLWLGKKPLYVFFFCVWFRQKDWFSFSMLKINWFPHKKIGFPSPCLK